MHCNRLIDQKTGELLAIVCSSRRNRVHLCACGASSRFQCDWKIAPGKTCDTHLCAAHAQEVGPDKHLCPAHQETYRQWRAARASPPPQPSTIEGDGV